MVKKTGNWIKEGINTATHSGIGSLLKGTAEFVSGAKDVAVSGTGIPIRAVWGGLKGVAYGVYNAAKGGGFVNGFRKGWEEQGEHIAKNWKEVKNGAWDMLPVDTAKATFEFGKKLFVSSPDSGAPDSKDSPKKAAAKKEEAKPEEGEKEDLANRQKNVNAGATAAKTDGASVDKNPNQPKDPAERIIPQHKKGQAAAPPLDALAQASAQARASSTPSPSQQAAPDADKRKPVKPI